MFNFWLQRLVADVVRAGFCSWAGTNFRGDSQLEALCGVAIARVGAGAGRDRDGFLSNWCVWTLDGSGRLMLFCGLFVPADGCERRSDESVIGLGLIIRACLDWNHWSVGMLLSVWQWGGQRWGRV